MAVVDTSSPLGALLHQHRDRILDVVSIGGLKDRDGRILAEAVEL